MSALFTSEIDVRWSDLDALGHVNNATYATYVEEARLRWFQTLDGAWKQGEAYPVVATQTVNYRRAVEWPARLVLELQAQRVGSTSLSLGFRLLLEAELVADGQTVLVWVDPNSGKPAPLPAALRAACERAMLGIDPATDPKSKQE